MKKSKSINEYPQIDPKPLPIQSQALESVKPSEIDSASENNANREGLITLVQETLGITDRELMSKLVSQTAGVMQFGNTKDPNDLYFLVSAFGAIGPKDGLEGLLAAQMIGTHSLSMEFLQRASRADLSSIIELNLNHANKLLRTFSMQLDVLTRLRGRGQQKMVVEHVHIHKGGQAVVGTVNQDKRRDPPGGTNDED